MKWIDIVLLLIVGLIPVGWGFWQLKLNEMNFKLNRKSHLFQQVVAASEEMREAYFNSPDRENSSRYLSAAKDMNSALAGIAIYAERGLAEKCFDLENLAKADSGKTRKTQMNSIIDLMRSELNLKKEKTEIKLDWN
jgi:hypothetical protein